MITFTSSSEKVGTEKIFTLDSSIKRDNYGWRRGGFAGNGVYVLERARNLIVIGERAYQADIDFDGIWRGERWEYCGVVLVTRHLGVDGEYFIASLVDGQGSSSPDIIHSNEWKLVVRWIRICD